MDKVGLGKTNLLGWAVVALVQAASLLAVRALWQTRVVAWRAVAAVPGLLAIFLAQAVLRTLFPGRRDAST